MSMCVFVIIFFLMIRRPPRSTRTDTLFSLHDALPICGGSCDKTVIITKITTRQITMCGPGGIHRYSPGHYGPESFFRSEEHTSELQSLMRISYAVFCLKKKKHNTQNITI